MGFGGAILHGLCTWNITCYALLKLFGASQAQSLKELQARFSSPVRPGDVLVVEAWRIGEEDQDGYSNIYFQTRTPQGLVVLSNGRTLIKRGRGTLRSHL